jgi:uridine kinase
VAESGTARAVGARVIGVTGGSGSGKSLFARALAERLTAETVALISEDDYYRAVDPPGLDPRRFDFDAPSARDHALLAGHLRRLRRGEAIDRPVYSFRAHAPLKRRVRIGPAAWVIVEGLHVLHDPAVRATIDFSIFLDVDADIRFIRRLLRDTRERGRSVRGISAQYLATVKPAHDRFVQPARAVADLVLQCETGEAEDATLRRWLDVALAALPAERPAGGADSRKRRRP